MLNLRFVLLLCLIAAAPFAAQDRPVTIRVGMLLDGKGGVQRNATIVVQGSKIQAITPNASNPTYDLRALTVMPGMIDTHVHINWHFGKDGRY
ncbi:MAG: amidohydrolase, partial [Acidobacteria bacterium]